MYFVSEFYFLVFLIFTGFAALLAAKGFRVPDSLIVAMVLAAAPVSIICGHSANVVIEAIPFALVSLMIGFVFYLFRILESDEAKLLSGVILWLGPYSTPGFLVTTAMFSIIIFMFLTALRFAPALTAEFAPELQRRFLARGAGVPYTLAIAPAGIFTMAARTGAFG